MQKYLILVMPLFLSGCFVGETASLVVQAPFEAVDAPRLYCSIGGRVSMESARMRDDIPPFLEKHGLEVDQRDPYSFYMGCIQLVMKEGEMFTGVADPRREGSAGGSRW